MKIAVIGEKSSTLAFHGIGTEVFGVETRKDIEKAKQEIEENGFAVVFVTETIFEKHKEELEELYGKTLPAVLTIPGASGKKEKKDRMDEIMERALGSKLNLEE